MLRSRLSTRTWAWNRKHEAQGAIYMQ